MGFRKRSRNQPGGRSSVSASSRSSRRPSSWTCGRERSRSRRVWTWRVYREAARLAAPRADHRRRRDDIDLCARYESVSKQSQGT